METYGSILIHIHTHSHTRAHAFIRFHSIPFHHITSHHISITLLVGALEHFLFSHKILGIILPNWRTHIFQDGLKLPTRLVLQTDRQTNRCLPSGKLLNMAIEIVDFPIKHGGSFHSHVKLPEGIYCDQDGRGHLFRPGVCAEGRADVAGRRGRRQETWLRQWLNELWFMVDIW